MKLLDYFATVGMLVLLLANAATIFLKVGRWYPYSLLVSFLCFFFYVWYQCYKKSRGIDYLGKGGGAGLWMACILLICLMLFAGFLLISNIEGFYV